MCTNTVYIFHSWIIYLVQRSDRKLSEYSDSHGTKTQHTQHCILHQKDTCTNIQRSTTLPQSFYCVSRCLKWHYAAKEAVQQGTRITLKKTNRGSCSGRVVCHQARSWISGGVLEPNNDTIILVSSRTAAQTYANGHNTWFSHSEDVYHCKSTLILAFKIMAN